MAVNFLPPYAMNGTSIPAEGLRRQMQQGIGAGSGVIRPGDLRISQLNTPGPGFKVAAGDIVIESRDPDSHFRETFGVSLPNEGTVDGLSGTGSGGAGIVRRDMVIHEILNPAAGKWFTEPPWAEGEYSRISVVQGVALNARTVEQVSALDNVTCYALAVIDYPASTATITDAMITNLSTVHHPQTWEAIYARPRVSEDDGAQVYLNATMASGGEYFPGGGGFANQFQVRVPLLATRAVIDARWMGVEYAASRDPRGRFRIEYGDEYQPNTWPGNRSYEFATQDFVFNAPGVSNVSSANWLLMDEVPIPAKLRGKVVTFVFKAGLDYNGGGSNSVQMKAWAGLGCRISFAQKTEAADLIVL